MFRADALAIFGRDAELASLQEFIARLAGRASHSSSKARPGWGRRRSGAQVSEEGRGSGSSRAQGATVPERVGALVLGHRRPVRPRARPRARLSAPRRSGGRSPARSSSTRTTGLPDPHAVGVAVLAAVASSPGRSRSCSRSTTCSARRGVLARPVRGARARDRACRRAPRAGRRSKVRSPRAPAIAPGRSLHRGRRRPLDAGALHRLVQADLGVALPRPLLREVRQASGGNPFYALEIVRTLQRTGASVEAASRCPCPSRCTTSFTIACWPCLPRAATSCSRPPHTPIRCRSWRRPPGSRATPGLPSARGRDRRARREPDRLHASAARRRRLRDRRSSPPRRDPRSPRELLETRRREPGRLAAAVDEPDETVAGVLEDAARHARSRERPAPRPLLLDRACE